MKIHPELFCIMIYQSRFSAMWLTQILHLVGDIESNPGLPHVCEMRRMWRLVLVHMHRNTNTYKSLTQATIHWTTQTKTYAYNKLTSTASATNMNSLSNLHTLHNNITLYYTRDTNHNTIQYTYIRTGRVEKLERSLLTYSKHTIWYAYCKWVMLYNIHWLKHTYHHQHTQYRTTNGQNPH